MPTKAERQAAKNVDTARKIKRMDVELAAAEGKSPEDSIVQQARYRYVKRPDLRDDELGYGDAVVVRFLTVSEKRAQGFQATIRRTRSGRVFEAKAPLPDPPAR
jgi:hypothetical protein